MDDENESRTIGIGYSDDFGMYVPILIFGGIISLFALAIIALAAKTPLLSLAQACSTLLIAYNVRLILTGNINCRFLCIGLIFPILIPAFALQTDKSALTVYFYVVLSALSLLHLTAEPLLRRLTASHMRAIDLMRQNEEQPTEDTQRRYAYSQSDMPDAGGRPILINLTLLGSVSSNRPLLEYALRLAGHAARVGIDDAILRQGYNDELMGYFSLHDQEAQLAQKFMEEGAQMSLQELRSMIEKTDTAALVDAAMAPALFYVAAAALFYDGKLEFAESVLLDDISGAFGLNERQFAAAMDELKRNYTDSKTYHDSL
ncbi:MAG: hypothetical protein IJ523_00960 [Succinivibrionaceae bacterium]|nr:hypothetical protein [Succinivibrionaceae bacterium]